MRSCIFFILLWFASFISYAEPLPATEVFRVETKRVDPNTFLINWQVKPGYFLYSDRIKLIEPPNSNMHLGTIRFPTAQNKTDQLGKTYTIYRHQLSLPIAVLGEQPGESLLDLHFQGCADDGFCYPPETRQVKLTIDNALALSHVNLETTTATATTAATAATPTITTTATPPDTKPENDAIEAVFNNHWPIIILSFFGFGLLLSFTPCVLPMIPVLSGIIVGHRNLSTRKAFFLSLSYVISMALTYAIVGAIIAELGSNLQIIMQTPWAIGLFSLIFVLLALSMFGFYELRLPLTWQAKLANVSRNQASGHYIGAALMGALSTLILSPCVTAPLIGALGYIAHSGNIALGSSALFFLGLGMGAPLLLIGTSAGKWLPKAGQWMNAVKIFFGILLLGVAIYLLGRILPGVFVMGLWAILLIFSGIYCGALTKAVTTQHKFCQGLGIILLIYGLLILVGVSMGSTNPLQPLAGLHRTEPVQNFSHKTVKTSSELQQAIANAKGKPIMLDFYADWCSSCKLMEATVFSDARVIDALRHFAVIKVDITANTPQTKALLEQFKVIAPPTFLFLNRLGEEQNDLRLVGEVPAVKFLSQLKQASDFRH